MSALTGVSVRLQAVPERLVKGHQVWLDKKSIETLFPHLEESDTPSYIVIAGRVHRLAREYFPEPATLGLTPLQRQDLLEKDPFLRGDETFFVTAFLPPEEDREASKVGISLKFLGTPQQRPTHSWKELQAMLKADLQGLWIQQGQKINFSAYVHTPYMLQIDKIEGDNGEEFLINEETEIFLTSSEVEVLDNTQIEPCEKLKIEISPLPDSETIAVKESGWNDRLIEVLRGEQNLLWDGKTFDLSFDGYKLRVNVLFARKTDRDLPTVIPKIFEIQGTTAIEVKDSGLTWVEKKPEPAVRLTISVQKASSSAPISAMALIERLRALDTPFILGRKISISLGDVDYQCVCINAQSRANPLLYETLDSSKKYRWNQLSDTEFVITKESTVNQPIVRTIEPARLKKACFSINLHQMHPGFSRESPHFVDRSQLIQSSREMLLSRHMGLHKGATLEVFCGSYLYSLRLENVESLESSLDPLYSHLFCFQDQTEIDFIPHQRIQFRTTAGSANLSTLTSEDLHKMGLGGMEAHVHKIITHVLSVQSGSLSQIARARKVRPVKGVLLYGPPGTGKTKFARQIGSILGCTEENNRLKMIAATEIGSRWYGESEERIRELFAPAEKAYKESKALGTTPLLHLIVIDEIDAILPNRSSGVAQHYTSIVNQFLASLDGLNSPPNILVIGITNNLEKLDPAATRPGRLELKVEIPLPNLEERLDILRLYATPLQTALEGTGVDLNEYARKTEGWSGADLESLVLRANGYSMERLQALLAQNSAGVDLASHPAGKITPKDFMLSYEEMIAEKEGISSRRQRVHPAGAPASERTRWRMWSHK